MGEIRGKIPAVTGAELKQRRSQMRSAGWQQGSLEAEKLIQAQPDLSPDEAKAAGLRLIAEREPVLRHVGATDDDLTTWAESFADAFVGKFERHITRRAERERKRALWRDARSMLKAEDFA